MGEFKRPSTPSHGLDDQNTLQVGLMMEGDVLRSISPGRMSLDSQDSCHTEDAEQKGFLDIHVRQAVRRSNSSVTAGMPVYPMTSNPRGIALIVDIRKYDNDVQDERYGSEVDRVNLTRLFQGLHFQVEVHKNLKFQELHEVLHRCANNPFHEQADMFILVVLSHGRDGKIITSGGREFPIESLYEQFNNQMCPLLKGKPKFFIIQACRGDEKDKSIPHYSGMEVSTSSSKRTHEAEASGDSPVSRRRRHGSSTDSFPWNAGHGDIDKARPTWEDMIIAYSTIPGYASMRDHDMGTWFVQSLVEVFMYHAADKELIDLLRMTSERLSQFTNEFNEKQTCNIEMRHLYKRIYFQPGLFEEPRRNRTKIQSPKLIKRSKSTPPPSPRRKAPNQDDLDEMYI